MISEFGDVSPSPKTIYSYVWSHKGTYKKSRKPWDIFNIPKTVLALEGFLLAFYNNSPGIQDCWLSAHLPRLA